MMDLIEHGRRLARRPEWGPSPPLWMTAMTEADWWVEAQLAQQETYSAFLDGKSQRIVNHGFAVDPSGDLFDFQNHLVEWACRKGRAAIFADCGMGKTPMQLRWADHVVRQHNKPVLVLTPLAVSPQTVREGVKFGIEVRRLRDGQKPTTPGVYVTNYEQLHHLSPESFAGIVCDESSAIKSFNGKRRAEVTRFASKLSYRLLCTATAAPNDYIELGTSSEALGELGYMDMLTRFFKNDQNSADSRGHAMYHGKRQQWRFKGHAEVAFWRWVCSWARACRKPSDLGYSDDRFVLPKLIEREHVVETRKLAPGMLFALPARNFREEREERRRTIQERCEMAAELVAAHPDEPSVVWCHLNDEGGLLERLIPGSRQIAGSTPDDRKEELYEAFGNGQLQNLVIKPKIGAWGLNWQHCAHIVTFASHSYEQYYQSVRRCWRFGQDRPVTVDLVVTEGESGVKDNLRRKSAQAERMFSSLVAHMGDALSIDRRRTFTSTTEVPSWLYKNN